MKHILNVVYSLLFILTLGLALIIGLSTFNTPVNLRFFTVVSGSMEPNIPLGSLVIVQAQPTYQANDVVTIKSEANPSDTFTHRILKVEEDKDIEKLQYVTKGDANEDADPEPSDHSRVLGKVITTIPFVGRIVAFAQTQTGFTALIVIPATVIVMSELNTIKNEIMRMWKDRKSPKSTAHHQPVLPKPAETTTIRVLRKKDT